MMGSGSGGSGAHGGGGAVGWGGRPRKSGLKKGGGPRQSGLKTGVVLVRPSWTWKPEWKGL